jgi:hypothetical protein
VTKIIKSYLELSKIPDFQSRLEYLKLSDHFIGENTFGFNRYLNQMLYSSKEWKEVRRRVLLRDNACDLAVPGFEIPTKALVHHINPITIDDIENRNAIIFDLNNLVTVSFDTHNAIHYGSSIDNFKGVAERRLNDTCPWRL